MKFFQSVTTSISSTIGGVALVAALLFATLPQPASALSCLNPTEMIPQFVSDDTYTIALVEAGTLETEGDMHDQQVTVLEAYKGDIATQTTVSFMYDETWFYLCAGTPAEVGDEALYIIRDSQVTQVFAADSELGQALLAELEEPTTPNEEPVVINPTEEERKGLMRQIITLLQQLVVLLGGSVAEVTVEPVTVTDYVGLTVDQAQALATENDVAFRLGMIDGEPLAVTMDYRPGRITASTVDDIVVDYSVE